MSTKAEVIASPKSCLNKAAPDEPIFVLRANDPRAPETIRRWVRLSQLEQDPQKLADARRIADRMDEWRERRAIKAVNKNHD